MVVKSLKIKNTSKYFSDDMICLHVNLLKIVKRESRICVDIYYIGYVVKKPKYGIDSINPFYLVVRHLIGCIKKIDGSSDRYLVVDDSTNKKVLSVFDKLWNFIGSEINDLMKNNDKITFGVADISIKGHNKLRFSSDVDLTLGVLIEFHTLTIVINCVIKKGGKYYLEIYLDECLYETDTI